MAGQLLGFDVNTVFFFSMMVTSVDASGVVPVFSDSAAVVVSEHGFGFWLEPVSRRSSFTTSESSLLENRFFGYNFGVLVTVGRRQDFGDYSQCYSNGLLNYCDQNTIYVHDVALFDDGAAVHCVSSPATCSRFRSTERQYRNRHDFDAI